MCHQLAVTFNTVDTCAIILDTHHIKSKGIIRTLPSDFITTGPSTITSLIKLFYYPTNAHNVINVELLKRIKIMEAAPTCFGLQRNHRQGATASA